MYRYHLIFESPQGLAENYAGKLTEADIESERTYAVGDVLEYEGRRWVVTQVPLHEPTYGATADLLLWPEGA